MRQKSGPVKAEKVVRDIRCATRRHELQPARARRPSDQIETFPPDYIRDQIMQNVRRLFDPGPVQSPSGFSSQDLIRLLRKHRAIVLFCCLVSSACVIVILRWLPAVYVSHAKILVRIEDEGSPSFFSGIASHREPNSPEPANRKMENEMELVETWPIAAEVVKRLNLTYDQSYLLVAISI